jgi:hypothetical protein
MNIHTHRRKRRRANAKQKFGSKAVAAHKLKTGRTGLVWSKRTKKKAVHYSKRYPNPEDASSRGLSL